MGNDAQWRSLADVLELPDLASDPALATNAGRLAQRERVVSAVAHSLRRFPAATWQRKLDAARVPCGIVKSVLEAIEDAGTASPLTGMPSSVGGRTRLPPPRLDEHGQLIRDSGWSAFARYP